MKNSQRSVRNVTRPGVTLNYDAPSRPLRLRKYIRPVVLAIGLIATGYLIFGSHLFDVRTIKTKGNQTLTTDELDRQTRALLKSSLLGNNWLFTNTKAVAAQLKSQNYQLGTVVVRKRLPTDLLIQVEERQPSLTWKSADKTYILSEEGKAFTVLQKSDPKLPLIVDQTNLPVDLGTQVVPKTFIVFANSVFSGLTKQGIAVEQASVTESTSELYVKTKKGYTIKFDTERTAEQQLNDLSLLLSSLSKQKKTVNEYIDLRIPQKVFYK